VLGIDPDAAAHYNWSNLLLLCGTDQACIAQRRAELANFLGTPAAPSLLRWSANYLLWQDNSPNETGFKIERFTSATGVWTEIATVGANVTLSKIGKTGNFTTGYRVRAFNSAGNSAYSNATCECTFIFLTAEPVFSDNFDDNSRADHELRRLLVAKYGPPYVILGSAVVAAVVTPPDAVSMLALLIPMCVLYEVGIFFSRFITARSKSVPQDSTDPAL